MSYYKAKQKLEDLIYNLEDEANYVSKTEILRVRDKLVEVLNELEDK